MADTKTMADNTTDSTKSSSKKPMIFWLTLTVGSISMILIPISLWIIYKQTLGYEPPITDEEKLRIAEKLREEWIEKSRHPSQESQVIGNQILFVDPLTVPFEEVVTNLNGYPPRMIKLEISFKVLDEYTYQFVGSPEGRTLIRDKILQSLQKKSFSDIESLQGKLLLKDELLTQVNQVIPDGMVRDLYFTEFVVQ